MPLVPVVIFCHGIVGNQTDLQPLAELVLSKISPISKDRAVIHLANSNRGHTLGDIRNMGERLANEIIDVLDSVDGTPHLHIVAHSLGGLMARCALGLLAKNCDSQIAFGDFITLSTPHLGIRRSRLFGYGARFFPSRSSIGQMALRGVDRSFVKQLCEEPYLEALSMFERRIALFSTGSDVTVAQYTAGLGCHRDGRSDLGCLGYDFVTTPHVRTKPQDRLPQPEKEMADRLLGLPGGWWIVPCCWFPKFTGTTGRKSLLRRYLFRFHSHIWIGGVLGIRDNLDGPVRFVADILTKRIEKAFEDQIAVTSSIVSIP